MADARRAAAAVACLLLVGCAGPTIRNEAIRSQAEKSSESMVSELRTVSLATRTQLDDNAWWRFTDLLVTDSEKTATTVESTFTSRQPPSRTIEPLYDQTSKALSDAAELVTDMRIAVRRQDAAEVRRLRLEINRAAEDLEKLEERLR